ncbi:sugar phosphate isomerase/epimerase family protein [Ramlibacter sp. MAHUQ-53]|uniref:sugar phosphate isomerase/epimerase family protein n=1 Tax=unclassified Ramlibacter TaxID=2617605 RepID=UPI003642B8AD
MIPAIDMYCYHRYFGEVYPGLEEDPGRRFTVDDVLARVQALGLGGVSLESCFFADTGAPAVAALRRKLDDAGLQRVWAWGHPGGLQSGADPQALADLVRHIGVARDLGARVMRICCGGRRTRPDDWDTHRRQLLPMLREAAQEGERHGVVLAIENHIDLLADELVELLETVASPALGVCLDTANNLRMLEDPVEVARKLAPWARATHVKDVAAYRGNPRTFAFWPSVPLGQGLVDLPTVLGLLHEAGYDGLLALEIDYLHPHHHRAPGDDERAIAASIGYLRGLLGEQHD